MNGCVGQGVRRMGAAPTAVAPASGTHNDATYAHTWKRFFCFCHNDYMPKCCTTYATSTMYRCGQSPRLLLAHGGSLTDHPYGDDQSVATEGELEDTAKVPQLGRAECQHLKTVERIFLSVA